MIFPLWTIIHVQLSTGEHGARKLSSFKWQFRQMCSQFYSRQASADLGLVFSVLFLTVLSVDLNLLLRLLLRLLQTTRFACLYAHKSRLIISERILKELSSFHSFQCFQSVECQKERPAQKLMCKKKMKTETDNPRSPWKWLFKFKNHGSLKVTFEQKFIIFWFIILWQLHKGMRHQSAFKYTSVNKIN